jgi:hypothetical protein
MGSGHYRQIHGGDVSPPRESASFFVLFSMLTAKSATIWDKSPTHVSKFGLIVQFQIRLQRRFTFIMPSFRVSFTSILTRHDSILTRHDILVDVYSPPMFLSEMEVLYFSLIRPKEGQKNVNIAFKRYRGVF